MLRGSLKTLVMAVVAGAMMIGAATQASASVGVVSVPAAIQLSAEASAVTVDSSEVQQAAQLLKAGQAVEIDGQNGPVATLRLNGTALSVQAAAATTKGATPNHADACWRAYTVASALLALGAVALATIIAAGLAVGATEITIVGITLTPGAWGAILGAMGSWSALLAVVAQYTC